MLISTVLVLLMTIPGLALFYGGLVRAKNMLSVLMQVFTITSRGDDRLGLLRLQPRLHAPATPIFGGFSKMFLAGVDVTTMSETFSKGVAIPELVFVVFQMTFACITPALIVGAFAERVKFSAVILFVILWVTFVYFPIAHMVWFWGGPSAASDPTGLIFGFGAIDFAGGTVVHINAGIAGLVGALMIGKRIGYKKDLMAPHSMTLTMVGASLLWVGWFGFNAGSNLEANAYAVLAMINTFVATAAAALTWIVLESLLRGKASMLGAVSGAVDRPRRGHPGGRLRRTDGRHRARHRRDRRLLLLRVGREEQVRAMTTASTCSASTASAASSARWPPASWSIRPSAAPASSTISIADLPAIYDGTRHAGLATAQGRRRHAAVVRHRQRDPLQDRRPDRSACAPPPDAEREGLDLTSHGEAAYHS